MRLPGKNNNLVKVNVASLAKITLVVERELRGLNVLQMSGSDFVYRVNVHSHFTTSAEKGATTTQILNKDDSGSKILIKGRYARTVVEAVSALEADLVRKLRAKIADLEKVADTTWLVNVLEVPAEEELRGEPDLPCTTWAGVNVGLVSLEEVD